MFGTGGLKSPLLTRFTDPQDPHASLYDVDDGVKLRYRFVSNEGLKLCFL